ncbi:MAG TPA: NAD-dependent epimerase/dehydratase family protein [Candidatus Acidoferrales bacterium]|nr:NAD-dependent epimerase/dehydratase family protein [Candidatus Acidoferrales bacterium]
MKVLSIGGTGFIGRFAVRDLVEMGHEVTVFHRGTSAVAGADSISGDRRELERHAEMLRGVRPEVVIDFLISNQRQAEELVARLGTQVRIVMPSSCDVYRAAGILHGHGAGRARLGADHRRFGRAHQAASVPAGRAPDGSRGVPVARRRL